jgi:hypothetical protein
VSVPKTDGVKVSALALNLYLCPSLTTVRLELHVRRAVLALGIFFFGFGMIFVRGGIPLGGVTYASGGHIYGIQYWVIPAIVLFLLPAKTVTAEAIDGDSKGSTIVTSLKELPNNSGTEMKYSFSLELGALGFLVKGAAKSSWEKTADGGVRYLDSKAGQVTR